jgi:hypothetical protein
MDICNQIDLAFPIRDWERGKIQVTTPERCYQKKIGYKAGTLLPEEPEKRSYLFFVFCYLLFVICYVARVQSEFQL